MKNVKTHILNQLNFLVKNHMPVFGELNMVVKAYDVYLKLRSDTYNQIGELQIVLTKKDILKKVKDEKC
jgi:hypothetical protein